MRASAIWSSSRPRSIYRTIRSATLGERFTSALNEILLIAAVVALIGAIGGLILVRSRDFIVPERPATETESAPATAVAA